MWKHLNRPAMALCERGMGLALWVRRSNEIDPLDIQKLGNWISLKNRAVGIAPARKNLRVEAIFRAVSWRALPIAQQTGTRDFMSNGAPQPEKRLMVEPSGTKEIGAWG